MSSDSAGHRSRANERPSFALVVFRADGHKVPLDDDDLDDEGKLTTAGRARVERVAHTMALESYHPSDSGNVEFIRLLSK